MSGRIAATIVDGQEMRFPEWSTTLLEPGTPNRPDGIEISRAISLKRIADSMERIAAAVEGDAISRAICEGINQGAGDWIGHMVRNGR